MPCRNTKGTQKERPPLHRARPWAARGHWPEPSCSPSCICTSFFASPPPIMAATTSAAGLGSVIGGMFCKSWGLCFSTHSFNRTSCSRRVLFSTSRLRMYALFLALDLWALSRRRLRMRSMGSSSGSGFISLVVPEGEDSSEGLVFTRRMAAGWSSRPGALEARSSSISTPPSGEGVCAHCPFAVGIGMDSPPPVTLCIWWPWYWNWENCCCWW
mmetsp:Transcript_23157/g.65050  ORF Transcript_23157/g.65050 Transcript_23157/m.65050 type:complete len:214 (-) Transcript_23157:99-740(-)